MADEDLQSGFSAWLTRLTADQEKAHDGDVTRLRTAAGRRAPDAPTGVAEAALESLVGDEGIGLALIISTQGLPIAAAGDLDPVDLSSLAVLCAGNALTNEGMAALLHQGRFASQLHEGERASVYVQLLGDRAVLLVVFEPTVAFGLLRVRAREAAATIQAHLDELMRGAVDENLSDGEVDALFRS